MSKIRLYFLARYDESDIMKQSFSKLFQASLDDVSINETIIPNISVIEISTLAKESVKSTRNLNVFAISSKTARMLSDPKEENKEVRALLKRFKNVDERENFNFLLQLLTSAPKETSWLK